MSNIVTTGGLKRALTFSFEDPKWGTKYLIGGLLVIASVIIPIIPLLLLLGYAARIIRRITNEDGQPALPEWNNWGDLLVDGLRLFGLYVIYLLPGILLLVFGYLAMLVPAISGRFDTGSPVAPLGAMLVMWFIMGLGTLLFLAASFFLGPAAVHTVAKSRFAAGFEFSAWWKVLRANLSGFVLTFALATGLSQLAAGAASISLLTVFLIFLVPFIAIAAWLYTGVVTAALTAAAYRDGMETLAVPQVMSE